MNVIGSLMGHTASTITESVYTSVTKERYKTDMATYNEFLMELFAEADKLVDERKTGTTKEIAS